MLLVAALGAAGGTGSAHLRPTTYSASVLLECGGDGSDDWYGTQIMLLQSVSLAEKAVQRLGLERDADFRSLVGNRVLAAARVVRDRITVARVENTRLLRVEVRDREPERAAMIANTVASLHIERSLERSAAATASALRSLAEESRAVEQKLERTERELQARLAPGEFALPSAEQRKQLAEEHAALTAELTRAWITRVHATSRVAKLSDAIDTSKPFAAFASEIDGNEQVQQLRAEYLRSMREQDDLAASAEAGSQALQQNTAKLASLVERMNATLEGILRGAQADAAEAQQVVTQLQAAVDRVAERSRQLELRELSSGRLERDRAEAEALRESLLQRANALRLADEQRSDRMRVLDPATTPTSPDPKPYLELALAGALIGFLLAGFVPAAITGARFGDTAAALAPIEPAETSRPRAHSPDPLP